MTTIDAINKRRQKTWTVADLHRRFGAIPFERIRQNPPPGSGTVDDVVRLNDHEDRLYELVYGILVEKTVGYEESFIAGKILTRLKTFVERRKLGLVAGEGGMLKLDIDLVRIPDVSFVSWDRVPGRKMWLDGGDVLPGFSVQVGKFFQKPKAPGGNGKRKKNGPRHGR